MDFDNADFGNSAAVKSFTGAGGGAEHFICASAPAELGFAEQIEHLHRQYVEAQQRLGLQPASAVFRRIFLSDVLNQKAALRASVLAVANPQDPVSVSIVQQPPQSGAKVALLAYHIDGQPIQKKRLSPHHLLVEKGGNRHLWTTQLCAGAEDGPVSPEAQTRKVFAELISVLEGENATLRDHCLRTWIYLKDVDVFYPGMVAARRELFEKQGLTANTHYIASTGIEGACAHRFDAVAMDAYSAPDVAPAQVSYLNAFDRLCPTKLYNVTFERGTRIAYADRAHLFISGTASIDIHGEVVHPNDVIGQLAYAIDNVAALLRSGAATMADMMYLLVYLRDPSDKALVGGYLDRAFPDLPRLILQAPVCRPGWLVEVEGIAITANAAPELPSF